MKPSTVTVTLPGPSLNGIKHKGFVYVLLSDVLNHIEATAFAFEQQNANEDVAKSFRHFGANLRDTAVRVLR